MESNYEDNGGISYTVSKPLVPDGKLPGGRNGASAVFVNFYYFYILLY